MNQVKSITMESKSVRVVCFCFCYVNNNNNNLLNRPLSCCWPPLPPSYTFFCCCFLLWISYHSCVLQGNISKLLHIHVHMYIYTYILTSIHTNIHIYKCRYVKFTHFFLKLLIYTFIFNQTFANFSINIFFCTVLIWIYLIFFFLKISIHLRNCCWYLYKKKNRKISLYVYINFILTSFFFFLLLFFCCF